MTDQEPGFTILGDGEVMGDILFDAPHQVIYQREDGYLRVKLRGMTNHELRSIIVGLWLRLEMPDRIDIIEELRHYLNSDSAPSQVSLAIGKAGDE